MSIHFGLTLYKFVIKQKHPQIVSCYDLDKFRIDYKKRGTFVMLFNPFFAKSSPTVLEPADQDGLYHMLFSFTHLLVELVQAQNFLKG